MGFAEGLNSGLQAVSNIAGLMQKRKEMDRSDALDKHIEEANKAGSQAYQDALKGATQSTRMTAGDMDAQPGFGQASQLGLTQPGVTGTLSLGGTPSLGDQVVAPQQMGGMAPNAEQGLSQSLSLGGAADPAEQTMTKQPSNSDDRAAILAGMTARRASLMKAGVDPKVWMPDWANEAKLRGEIRTEKLDDADKRFAATGDPMEWAKVVYPLVDDGKTLVAAKPFKNLDGSTGWNFTTRNDATGEESTNQVSTEQFDRMRAMARDPAAVIKGVEVPALLEQIKAQSRIKEEQGKQAAVQGTEAVKHANRLGEIGAQTNGQLAVTNARTGGQLSVVREQGKQKRMNDDNEPLVLGPDQTIVDTTEDGSYKPVFTTPSRPKASGDGGANTSAPNKILQLRSQAEAAMRTNPANAKQIKDRFKKLTGKDF